MKLNKLKRLTATHRTELFLLALSGILDISFGIEKLFVWKNAPIPPLWMGVFFLSLGLLIGVVGVMNLVRDVREDCGGPDGC
jgi:hypothetical protein